MKSLELLLKQEYLESKLEDFLVYYSISTSPSIEPKEIPFSSISAYADSLNQQFGIPSPSIKPLAPSSLVTVEDVHMWKIKKSLNKPFQSSVSEAEINYANSLNQQFNVPSPTIKPPIPSSSTTPQTFDPNPVLEAIKNPICPSLSNKPLTVSSQPVKPSVGSQSYNPNSGAPQFQTSKLFHIDNPRPEKKFYDLFNKKHRIKIFGLRDTNPVYDLFKKNELPRIYKQVSEGLKLGNHAVRTIAFVNPLKDEKDISPSFTPWKKEIRLPALKPKKIPFDTIPQKDYNKMLNNAFLPHEMGHAKIEDEYSNVTDMYKPELQGFNEHLADAFAFDSVKNTPQLFKTRTERIKFEDKWVTPLKNNPSPSKAVENYDTFISDKEDASFIPGKQATVSMLGDPFLKQKYDYTLKNVLDFKYGDDPHKHTIYDNINDLSNLYQDQAIKLVNLSKRNSIFSGFKARKILSEVEKKSLSFMEDL